MGKQSGITRMQYGLEIIEGLMGAGKSYYAVRRICKIIEEERRPVFTNLPLRWPVMRKYLRNRGGEELASLIHPLKEQHWRNFLQRQHMYAQFREQRSGRSPGQLDIDQLNELAAATGKTHDQLKRQTKIQSSQMSRWFQHVYGEDTFEGKEADSIPLGSLIVIDEVQHWHPMLRQSKDEVSEHLQAYLTMCRHHLHWIWVITQDRTRINILFRNLTSSVWRVWDRGEDRLAWGIRFKHLGLRGMGYERYTRDQLEQRDRENIRPSESFTIIPQLPINRVYYRLYDSFTNVGSKRQIKKLIEQTRQNAGLTADGTTQKEIQQREQEEMNATKKPSLIKRLIRRGIRTSVLVTLLTIAFAIGANINPRSTEETIAQIEPEQQPIQWPSFNGLTSKRPLFNGHALEVGEDIVDGATLAYYDRDARACVVIARDGYWLWYYGQTQPEPVGTVQTIRAAYSRMVEAEGASAAVENDRAAGGPALELGDG